MAQEKDIFTEEGDRVKWAEKSPNVFVDKTTLIFGQTNSGKTVTVEEILYFVRDYIPNYIIIAPLTSQKPYLSKFPKSCIKEDLSKELFYKIWKRQEWTTQLYNIANDRDTLYGIFKKINNHRATTILNEFLRKAELAKKEIDLNSNLDYGQKKTQMSNIDEKIKKEAIKLMKQVIRMHRHNVKRDELTNAELIAFEYLDINPRIMIIVDDCTDKMPKWMKMFKKGEENMFHNIFFRGRHNYISMLMVVHNDKMIDTELRNGAMRTIFTDMKSLMLVVHKPSNGFTKEEVNLALRCAKRVFNVKPPGCEKNYQKLCYVKTDADYPFQYTVCDEYPDSKIGCLALYELDNNLKKRGDEININPFIKSLIKGSAGPSF